MIVKRKILIALFLFGNFLVFLGLYFNHLSIGFCWYSINANSLVGFQKVTENLTELFPLAQLNINNFILFILDTNLFLSIGIFFLLLTIFLSVSLTHF